MNTVANTERVTQILSINVGFFSKYKRVNTLKDVIKELNFLRKN